VNVSEEFSSLVRANKIHILRGENFDLADRVAMATKRKKKVAVPKTYRPKEGERFMNPTMSEYFRRKLQGWKDELLRDSNDTIQGLQTESLNEADIADRASAETDRSLLLRTRDRERKLISKIDAALSRLDDGSYGYCEDSTEPISVQRLEARPIATLSIEAQERHERMERTHRGD
jgi:DnaK suppressor protein